MMSLPSWERGLKSGVKQQDTMAFTSPPSWERGLKFTGPRDILNRITVAPLVGAWIEMMSR